MPALVLAMSPVDALLWSPVRKHRRVLQISGSCESVPADNARYQTGTILAENWSDGGCDGELSSTPPAPQLPQTPCDRFQPTSPARSTNRQSPRSWKRRPQARGHNTSPPSVSMVSHDARPISRRCTGKCWYRCSGSLNLNGSGAAHDSHQSTHHRLLHYLDLAAPTDRALPHATS